MDFEDIFDIWRSHEGSNPDWIYCATKINGWPDWDSWRRYMLSLLKPEKQTWNIYEINDANTFIPDMQIGPFEKWQEMLPEENKYTFLEALEFENFNNFAKSSEKIQDIIKNFPKKTQLMAVYDELTKKIICIEGTHRSAAVAYAKKIEKPISFNSKPKIAIMVLKEMDRGVVKEMIARGGKNRE